MALAVMRLAKDRGHESFDENTVRELKAVVAASSRGGGGGCLGSCGCGS